MRPSAPDRLDVAELRHRLRRTDSLPPAARQRVRGDHDLNADSLAPAQLIPAGVLVPIVAHDDGLTVMLTQRTQHLAAHAGQISFPGGRMEPEDADALAAALRETEEEVGLPRERIDVIGRLDPYIVRTGFRVEPFVGLIRPPFILKPDANEVAEVFEVPLDWILAPGRPERHSRLFQGRERWFYAFPFEDRYIWGATAGMLVNLRELLSGAPAALPVGRPPAGER